MRGFVFLLLCALSLLEAHQKVDVKAIIRAVYPDTTKIETKSGIITKKELPLIQKKAKANIKSKLYRYFIIHHSGKTAIAIVSSQKVRTKKAAILYFIENGSIHHTEILAFGEPPEFLPSKKWLKQFDGKSIASILRVGEDIAAKSGATLSAKSVTNGAKTVLAIYEVKLKQ